MPQRCLSCRPWVDLSTVPAEEHDAVVWIKPVRHGAEGRSLFEGGADHLFRWWCFDLQNYASKGDMRRMEVTADFDAGGGAVFLPGIRSFAPVEMVVGDQDA